MLRCVPLFMLLALCQRSTSLRLTKIVVPEIVDHRDIATLSCSYDMGTNALNSVKWYKDNDEFFRYAPMMSPTISRFSVDGVHLADQTLVCNKITCSIQLQRLEARTSGSYRCEISGDAPEFKQASRMSNMTIAALPQFDPEMTGIAPNYAFGEFVQANCTTDRSSPPSSISWFINDVAILPNKLQRQLDSEVENDVFPLRSRSQEIRFFIDQTEWGHLKVLSIKCLATLDGFPSITRERIQRLRITSRDDLSNERLVNLKNSGSWSSSVNQFTMFTVFVAAAAQLR